MNVGLADEDIMEPFNHLRMKAAGHICKLYLDEGATEFEVDAKVKVKMVDGKVFWTVILKVDGGEHETL